MLLGTLQAPVAKFARAVQAVADAKPAEGSAVAEPVKEEAAEAAAE